MVLSLWWWHAVELQEESPKDLRGKQWRSSGTVRLQGDVSNNSTMQQAPCSKHHAAARVGTTQRCLTQPQHVVMRYEQLLPRRLAASTSQVMALNPNEDTELQVPVF